MTTSGRAVATTCASASPSNTSTTTGVIPIARSIGPFSGVRVVPVTSCLAWRSRPASRRPTTPVAPARKTLICASEKGSPILRCVLQPLQRFEDLFLARHRSLALFLFFLDDLFARIGDELLIAKLGIDALDIGIGLGDFLVEPRPFGGEIDHPLERKRCDLAAHQKLNCALGRAVGEGNVGHARHALDDVAP